MINKHNAVLYIYKYVYINMWYHIETNTELIHIWMLRIVSTLRLSSLCWNQKFMAFFEITFIILLFNPYFLACARVILTIMHFNILTAYTICHKWNNLRAEKSCWKRCSGQNIHENEQVMSSFEWINVSQKYVTFVCIISELFTETHVDPSL